MCDAEAEGYSRSDTDSQNTSPPSSDSSRTLTIIRLPLGLQETAGLDPRASVTEMDRRKIQKQIQTQHLALI